MENEKIICSVSMDDHTRTIVEKGDDWVYREEWPNRVIDTPVPNVDKAWNSLCEAVRDYRRGG